MSLFSAFFFFLPETCIAITQRKQAKKMNIVMRRGLASLTNTATATATTGSYCSLLRLLCSSTAADVDASASSSVAKVVNPTLLQPRVVLYDGVCHLCHRGIIIGKMHSLCLFYTLLFMICG